MLRMTQIRLNMDEPISVIPEKIRKKLNMKKLDISEWKIVKESIDARKKPDIKFTYTVDFAIKNEDAFLEKKKNVKGLGLSKAPDMSYEIPMTAELREKLRDSELSGGEIKRPVVVGFGPCGMFAGLILAEAGLKPVIIERGRDVRRRTEDVEKFWSEGKLDPVSNVQFGEGGAGTFSDGKLTTGIKDRRMVKVREEFIEAGADPDIAYRHMPHIGTDVLRNVVEKIRKKIISLGGEVMFETKLTGLRIKENAADARLAADTPSQEADSGAPRLATVCPKQPRLAGITLARTYRDRSTEEAEETEEKIDCDYLVLGPGNSARDTFRMLHNAGIKMEAKPFSVGVRIEHPQSLIDLSQYGFEHSEEEGRLGAAAYKLSYHTESGRGVYTFCMCPGGVVVGAASEENTVVTNGMSYRARDGKNANSALLVDVNPEDLPGGGSDVLAGIRFQEEIERRAFTEGGGDYFAPVETVGEFMHEAESEAASERGKSVRESGEKACETAVSVDKQETAAEASGYRVEPTYRPGVRAGKLGSCLPAFVTDALREAIPDMARRLKGFDMTDAVMTCAETRSSCPVRIVRDGESLESVSVSGLYPGGEGAGYAGGIMSAGVDGIRIAEKIIEKIVRD